MNYYRLGIIFLFFSIILIFFIFYYSSLTRESEKKLELANSDIFKIKDKIKINELEFAAHTNPSYLKKLEKIYYDNINIMEENVNLNIINIEQFDSNSLEQVFNVKLN